MALQSGHCTGSIRFMYTSPTGEQCACVGAHHIAAETGKVPLVVCSSRGSIQVTVTCSRLEHCLFAIPCLTGKQGHTMLPSLPFSSAEVCAVLNVATVQHRAAGPEWGVAWEWTVPRRSACQHCMGKIDSRHGRWQGSVPFPLARPLLHGRQTPQWPSIRYRRIVASSRLRD